LQFERLLTSTTVGLGLFWFIIGLWL